MKRGFVVLFLLIFHNLQAQKLVKKSLINSGTSLFQIDTGNCFDLDLATSNTDELVVEAAIEGEYRKDLVIRIMEEGSTVLISAGFQPLFISPNDKLSAHKVVSIALRIRLPEIKEVQVFGTSCNVHIGGFFRSLEVVLDDGRCTLNGVKEKVEVSTQSGDIILNTSEGFISAESRYGKVIKDVIPQHHNTFALRTVTGDISLNKTN